MGRQPSIWTIGHSNHPLERFAALLRAERIECVVDVRSHPYSRFADQFNRETLDAAMKELGVRYLFLGDELGGRPSHVEHYDERGRARYDLMARAPAFTAAVQRLLNGCRKHRIALVCSEGRPDACHRRLLVGKVLAEHGVSLNHILPDGAVRREGVVALDSADGQQPLFEDPAPRWISTQSVSRRRRLSISSTV